jgi:hypothetical protein
MSCCCSSSKHSTYESSELPSLFSVGSGRGSSLLVPSPLEAPATGVFPPLIFLRLIILQRVRRSLIKSG